MKQFRPYRPWAAFAVIALLFLSWLAAGIYADLSQTNEELNMNAFEPYVLEAVEAGVFTQKKVNVFVETDASMRGFLDETRRQGCVPHSYKEMLTSLEETVKPLGTDVRTAYYGFSKEWQGSMAKSALLNQETYQPLTEQAQARSGYIDELATALANVEKGSLTMIFTDLESGGGSQEDQILELTQGIFEAGDAIIVQRFISAYGGMIYDYGGLSTDIAYGSDEKGGSKTAVIAGVPYFHRLPRAFYVILIGDGDECEILRQQLCAFYDGLKIKHMDETTTCNAKHDYLSYWAYDEVRYEVLRSRAVLCAAGDISFLQTQRAALLANSPWAQTHGVYEYLVQKGNEAQIPFSFTPKVDGFGQSYFGVCETPRMSVYKVAGEKAKMALDEKADVQMKPKDFLLGRGLNGTKLTLIQHPAGGVFTAAANVEGNKVAGALNIDTLNAEKGLYRVVLGLWLKPTVGDNANTLKIDKADWSVQIQAISAAGWTVESNPFIKTIGVQQKLETILRAYKLSEADVSYPVANVTIDVRIR